MTADLISKPDARPVVMITGAGGGLGQPLTRAFADGGWRVGAGWRRTSMDPETDSVLPLHCDVTDRTQTRQAVDRLLQKWGRVDALVNNAGCVADRLVGSMSEADWDRVIAVNLKGAFLCSRAVLPPMIRQRSGHIISMISFSALGGNVGQANYAAAKAGVIGLTESLAREVGSRNICVNAVCPGVLPTAMTNGLAEQRLEELKAANTLGRLNSIEEVAGFIVHLASMRNVSGQWFNLDSRIHRWT